MYNRDYLIRASRFLNEDTEERIVANNDNIKRIVRDEIKRLGNKADLNHIDVSDVTNMWGLFEGSDFNGDISKWNVGNVENMGGMFFNSKFNGDISNWDVSNVEVMSKMFPDSKFNQDISNWDVSRVKYKDAMFNESKRSRVKKVLMDETHYRKYKQFLRERTDGRSPRRRRRY